MYLQDIRVQKIILWFKYEYNMIQGLYLIIFIMYFILNMGNLGYKQHMDIDCKVLNFHL